MRSSFSIFRRPHNKASNTNTSLFSQEVQPRFMRSFAVANAWMPYDQRHRINALRLIGLLTLGGLAVVAPPEAPPIVTVMHNLCGTAAIFVAVAGRAWCLFYIGGRKNLGLVTSGPYSMIRNPLYFFSLVGIVGLGAKTGSLLATAMFVFLTLLAFEMAIRGEERYLALRFGSTFEKYKTSVPRLWPDLSLWRETHEEVLHSASAIKSLKDGVVFFAAWFLLDLIALGQAANILPILWNLPL